MTRTADLIYRFITENGYGPGDQLPVRRELQRLVGLGPRRLREGLSVLEHHGVVESRTKGGTIVCRPTAEPLAESFRWHVASQDEGLAHMIRARACIEASAAYEAARYRTARDLLKILDALERLQARQAQGETDWNEEMDFHLAVLAATHNGVMETFEMLIVLNLKRDEAMGIGGPDMTASNREHESIYEAIRDRRALEAMQLMYGHIVKDRIPEEQHDGARTE